MISRVRAALSRLTAADAAYAQSQARRQMVLQSVSPSAPPIQAGADLKESNVKSPVRILPTSNGYLIAIDVAPGLVAAPDALIVVEASAKNADDVAHAIGAAVVRLTDLSAATPPPTK